MSEEIVDIAFCHWEVLPGASDFGFLGVGAELAATADVMAAEQIGVGNEVAFAGCPISAESCSWLTTIHLVTGEAGVANGNSSWSQDVTDQASLERVTV